jgi:GntR family transcriptional regulator/MocR family aminotransferase
MQLTIPIRKRGGAINRQLYVGLREAILAGPVAAGDRLPATRDLAEQLGISRTVVLLAYDQLLAEGFVEGRMGSGTYVSSSVSRNRTVASGRAGRAARLRQTRFGQAACSAWSRINFPRRKKTGLLYDFAYGLSDLETFPFEKWRRALLRCARRAAVAELDYGPAGGNRALREAICAHLRRSRAVMCESAQVLVVNGSQQALDLIARVLIERGDHVAIEDPSYQGTREVLRAAGAHIVPVAVDREGVKTEELPHRARMAFVTPSHQFPTGAVLSLARRLELLRWARRNNAVIVEDDYDGEFRYGGQPLESLQGLDRQGRVIYIGTFSRTIFSALRIGYLIAPAGMVAAFEAAKWLCDRHTATLEQQTLAEFMLEGSYELYLRRVRRRNAARRNALLESIESHLGQRVEVTGEGAGAHLVIWPKRPVDEKRLIAAAAARSVGIYGLAPYFLDNPKPAQSGILLGYARMKERGIREGIKRLGEAIALFGD